jgi:uncharacterized membrane protein
MSNPVTKSIIVGGSPSDIYAIWSNFAMFPQFMKYIEEVTITGANRSHWVMKGPMGYIAEWEAETTRMETDKRIAWRSIDTDETNVKTSGQVTFNELPDNQTEVTVTMHYVPPAGVAGEVAAALFANPEERLEHDLENFKRFVEGTMRKAVTHTEASRMGNV